MSSKNFKLLVGLGNPGKKYNETRHNIGFMALEKLVNREGVDFCQHKKINGQIASIQLGQETRRILLPNTFMNESGRSIRAALAWYGVEINQLLVLVDDMDLPLGKLRLRLQGGSGGHNGLKSIIHHLGTNEFSRIRIGIGSPSTIPEERKEKTTSHVLGSFTNQEIPIVKDILEEILISLDLIVSSSIENACTHINSYQSKSL